MMLASHFLFRWCSGVVQVSRATKELKIMIHALEDNEIQCQRGVGGENLLHDFMIFLTRIFFFLSVFVLVFFLLSPTWMSCSFILSINHWNIFAANICSIFGSEVETLLLENEEKLFHSQWWALRGVRKERNF